MTCTFRAGAMLLGLVTACTVTNTGNPNEQNGDGPEGIALSRSGLARDTAPMLSSDERTRFGSDNRDFAFTLYREVKDESENLFFSPYSISVALAMTYAGAEGETEQQMASALSFGLPEPTLHAAFNATDLTLQGRADELVNSESSGDGFTLQLTNALFAQKDRSFVDAYLDTLALHYGAGVYRADFASHPERERMAINDWVLERTEQRIDELLPPDSIAPNVALVLVNAIYFKASWLDKFDPSRTEPAIFEAPGGDVNVQMMDGFAEQYMRGEDYAALELPYISEAVRVLFVLPDEGQMAAVEAKLNRELFDETRQALASQRVMVQLPRFKFDAELKLKPALEALGMPRPFQAGAADLSGISGAPGELYIDEVYHQAFVAMDEAGTEATAATSVVVATKSDKPPPVEFIANRPFLFFIYDEPTGQILFAGRLNAPSE